MAKTIVVKQIGSPIRRPQNSANADRPGPEQDAPHPRTGRHPFRARHGQQDPAHGRDHRRKGLRHGRGNPACRTTSQDAPARDGRGVFYRLSCRSPRHASQERFLKGNSLAVRSFRRPPCPGASPLDPRQHPVYARGWRFVLKNHIDMPWLAPSRFGGHIRHQEKRHETSRTARQSRRDQDQESALPVAPARARARPPAAASRVRNPVRVWRSRATKAARCRSTSVCPSAASTSRTARTMPLSTWA